jgi:hypothetical protein
MNLPAASSRVSEYRASCFTLQQAAGNNHNDSVQAPQPPRGEDMAYDERL